MPQHGLAMKILFKSIQDILMFSLAVLTMASPAFVLAQSSPFDVEKDWRGQVDIAPGKYQPKFKVVLGARLIPGDKKLEPAQVTTGSGTEIEKADILIDEGQWNAQGTRFADTQLKIDLGGELVATNSLFQDCVLRKGGAWFVRYHSSKWTFNQCVFTGQFIAPMKLVDIGVKVTNCTFYDVDLSVVQYREDIAEELTHEWMKIENCRFVRCKVPESFLLMTKNCVFDGCTFGRAESEIPIRSPVSVQVHLLNANSSKPKAGKNRDITVIQGDILIAGATSLQYQRNGKTLSFK
ncbi:hypothetical protein SAMN02745166_00926 [Prosthecobacter debontii]|uniref:Right handed beta helix region n=2 Tax=Prosthecobacter debontii TaxID=48467 RepID=A0A1T4WYU0_9BACT|nr:hypothetical protein SAMN02745166_00926 [Prosthecobacter debontii]